MTSTASHILDFWFRETSPEQWFQKSDHFDKLCARRFGEAVEQARAGDFHEWERTPQGILALILLLDQMPRNIYRDTPQAFAGDAQALGLSEKAIARGDDAQLNIQERQFLYMPFMHSEQMEDQERSMELFTKLGDEKALHFAKLHRDIIARFGRFPHRNEIVGRNSTPEEIEFLKQPGSSF